MDWISFFEDYGIEYVTKHKHVTEGWVGINCPFCGDSNFHMGINLNFGTVHCWRCGGHTRRELLKALTNEDPKIIYKKYGSHIRYIYKENETQKQQSIYMPTEFIGLTKPYREFLKSRGYDPDEIQLVYDVLCCNVGEYKGRLIIPFYENGQLVTWQGRAIRDSIKPRYKSLSSSLSVKTVKEVLYNESAFKDYVIVVEGVFDVWRYGFGAVSVSGTEVSDVQFEKLLQYKKIILAMDSDYAGILAMTDLYSRFAFYGKEVYILLLDDKAFIDSPVLKSRLAGKNVVLFKFGKKDFGELNQYEIREIKKKNQ